MGLDCDSNPNTVQLGFSGKSVSDEAAAHLVFMLRTFDFSVELITVVKKGYNFMFKLIIECGNSPLD